MGGRLFIFSAYTPLNFSVLGVGADPWFSDITLSKVHFPFSIFHITVTGQNVFFGLNDVVNSYTNQTKSGFKKN